MIRVSKLGDYAIVLMAELADCFPRPLTANGLVEATGIHYPTASKLLKMLVSAGLVHSSRGRRGGYQLTRAPEAIDLMDVVEAIEGPICLAECGLGHAHCALEGNCRIQRHWMHINAAIRQVLEAVSLADLAAPPQRLERPLIKLDTRKTAGETRARCASHCDCDASSG